MQSQQYLKKSHLFYIDAFYFLSDFFVNILSKIIENNRELIVRLEMI